jgi:hypothetical protein
MRLKIDKSDDESLLNSKDRVAALLHTSPLLALAHISMRLAAAVNSYALSGTTLT